LHHVAPQLAGVTKRSVAGEVPGAAFCYRPDPLGGIVGRPQPLLFFQLVLGRVGDCIGKSLAHGCAHGYDGERCVFRDLRGERARGVAQLVCFDELIGEADLEPG